jgi:hypothetical protein
LNQRLGRGRFNRARFHGDFGTTQPNPLDCGLDNRRLTFSLILEYRTIEYVVL